MASKKKPFHNNNKLGQTTKAQDQLTAILPSLSVKTPFGTKLPYNAGQWKTEGYDHINISRFSNVHLGRQLDFDFTRMFEHPLLGPFKTINSLWHFIRAKQPHDHIRMLFGNELRSFVQRECGGFVGVLNFRAIVMHSAYLRVKGDNGLKRALLDSTLPFDCYRTIPESGIRMRFEHSHWMVGGYEEIRTAMKEKREPNFDILMDRVSANMYEEVIRRLAPDTDPNPDTAPVRKVVPQEKAALTGAKSYDIVDIDYRAPEDRPLSEKQIAALAEKEFASEYGDDDGVEEKGDEHALTPVAVDVVQPVVQEVEETVSVADIAEALEGKYYPASVDEMTQDTDAAAEAVVELPVEPVAETELPSPSDLIESVVTLAHVEEAHRLVAEELAAGSVEEAPAVVTEVAVEAVVETAPEVEVEEVQEEVQPERNVA